MIKSILTNCIGHTLAILNLAFVAFAHLGYGDAEIMGIAFFHLNWPTLGVQRYVLDVRLTGLLFPLIMYAQWLVIGWFTGNVTTLLKRKGLIPA